MGSEKNRSQKVTDLGEREETLGDVDDILHLLNRLDAVLDDLGVLGTGGVEDVTDALDVALSPVTVGLLDSLYEGECEQTSVPRRSDAVGLRELRRTV